MFDDEKLTLESTTPSAGMPKRSTPPHVSLPGVARDSVVVRRGVSPADGGRDVRRDTLESIWCWTQHVVAKRGAFCWHIHEECTVLRLVDQTTLPRALHARLGTCLCVPKIGFSGTAASLACTVRILQSNLKTCTSTYVEISPPRLEG